MSARWDEAGRADMKALAEQHGARLKRSGRHWIGACPKGCASADGFVVTPDKQKFFCRPSREGGGAVSLIMHVRGCSKEDAVAFLNGKPFARPRETAPDANNTPRDPMKSWRNALTFRLHSAAYRYLDHRGLILSAAEAESIRCSPDQYHWPTQSRYPAMLARVSLADGTDLSTHQTFLTPDGRKAELGDRARLFPAGSRTVGGGVWFGVARPDYEFIVGEGIESTLSAMRIYSADAGCAALSAFGVSRLILPPAGRKIRIFADHDAFNQGLASARVAAERWRAEGRTVALVMSPNVGFDANDVWFERLGKERCAS
jgi:putative DNA primase/helicase